MRTSTKNLILLACLSIFSATTHAALVHMETSSLLISFDNASMGYLGFPELQGDTLVFTPGMQLGAPANQITYYDVLSYSATLDVRPKPGFTILGYNLTASGSSYVGDDANMGLSGTFNKALYGASYYSGTLAGDGPWSASEYVAGPTLPPIAGDMYIQTVNHYSYLQETLVQVPVFEEVPVENIVGYQAVYNEFGEQIGAEPIIEIVYVHQIVRYDWVPSYETVYQTSGGEFRFERMTVEVLTAPVPVPPAGLLFMSALAAVGVINRRQRGKPHGG